MKKKKELYIQARAVAGTAAVLVLVGLAQQRCIGQNYFEIIVDNKVVGATGQKTDEKEMLNTCRRELNELTDGYVCLDADIEIRKARTFGTRLLTKTEAEQCVLEELKHKVVTEGTSAYTVNIGEFTASFPTLEDVGEFLSTVKQPYDAEGKFSVCTRRTVTTVWRPLRQSWQRHPEMPGQQETVRRKAVLPRFWLERSGETQTGWRTRARIREKKITRPDLWISGLPRLLRFMQIM